MVKSEGRLQLAAVLRENFDITAKRANGNVGTIRRARHRANINQIRDRCYLLAGFEIPYPK